MKRKQPMSDAQRAALKEGEAIRNILLTDSIARRYFEPDLQQKVREICNEQMHRLGRENLDEHRERINEALIRATDDDWPPNKFFRYQKLETQK